MRVFAVNHEHGTTHPQGRMHHSAIFPRSTGQLFRVKSEPTELDFRGSVHTDQHGDNLGRTHSLTSLPNDEVERRGVASALNEGSLSQSSTPSLANGDVAQRS